MKKKVTLITAAAAMGALLAVGGTLAWFTDSEEVTNTITVDSMDFTLTEPEYVEADYQAVTPGATIIKDPTITNIDNQTGYVKITVMPMLDDGDLKLEDLTYALNDIESGKYMTLAELADYWNNKEDYEAALSDDETTLNIYTILEKDEQITIFDKVKISEDCKNNIMDNTFSLKIAMEAIQKANNPLEENQTIAEKFAAFAADGGEFETVVTPAV